MTTTSSPSLAGLPTGPLGKTGAVPLVSLERPAIPGFEIGEPLGRGGMGVVFRARELATDRDVAVKWLPARAEEVLRRRFEREARTAAAVKHPNIVPVLSAGSVAEGSYIVMELVDGFSLGAALRAKALGRNALLDVCAKVARALHAAHERGVVHRDVKPENVVVDATGEPRLLDFGLARFLEAEGHLTRKNTALGTLGYMAPEVLAGGGAEAGPPCDVFALGAILYEGLAGTPAFGDGESRSVIERVTKNVLVPLPAGTPPLLAALAREALAPDPAKRPTALAFAERLEALARPAQAPAAEPARRARATPVLLAGAVVAGAALGALGVGLALRARPAPSATPEKTVSPAPPETAPVPSVAKGAPAKAAAGGSDLDATWDEILAAISRDDRAHADELARQGIALAPKGEEKRMARLHAVLARDALMDLKTAEAQREYAKALDLEPGNGQALAGSYAAALLEGDAALASRRLATLEEKAHSVPLACARALAATAKREHGFRFQLATAAGMPRADAPLMKVVAGQLLAREPDKRK